MNVIENYPIYIIYSSWSLATIKNFLLNLMPDSVSIMKIIYDAMYNETNKTIVVLKEELYNLLIQQGYGVSRFEIDFKIKKYKFNENILPSGDKTNNLFIPIIKKTTESIVTSIINQKLDELALFKIIPEKSWRLKCPINSRENGHVKLGCFIFFRNDITVYNISIVKFLLNNTHWVDNEDTKYDNTIKCYWARPRVVT
jgi:hypothetical protein